MQKIISKNKYKLQVRVYWNGKYSWADVTPTHSKLPCLYESYDKAKQEADSLYPDQMFGRDIRVVLETSF